LATMREREPSAGGPKLETKVMGEDHWTKRNKESGRFMDQKADDKMYKGVRREKK